MATGLETFLEALARIPGLGFIEQYSNKARKMRHQVRSHRERAEELQDRAGEVKDAANPAGTPAQQQKREVKRQERSEAAGKNIRDIRRVRGEKDMKPSPRPRSGGAATPEQKKGIRDNSPDRDKGRSLRKRKDEI